MMDRLLRNNNIVKIIAAVLAIMLWLTVHAGDEEGGGSTSIADYEASLDDKAVTVLYDERDVSLVNEPKVSIHLKGPIYEVITALNKGSEIKLVADARGLDEGTHQVDVLVSSGLPTTVTYDPIKVKIQLEANVNREFAVKLNTTGKPQEGLGTGEPIIQPATVVASGSKSNMDRVKSVVADISLADADEEIRTSVPLIPVDADGKPVLGIHLSPERAEVMIPIIKPSKSVPLRLQFKGEVKQGYAVEAIEGVGNVTIFGAGKTLDAIDSFPAPPIEMTDLDKTTKFTLKLANVEGVTTVEPDVVEVTVRVVEAAEKTFEDVPVKVTGLTGEESYKVVEPQEQTVDIVVSGAPGTLDKLTVDDIYAFIDLSKQPAGQHEMRVQVNTPNFIKLGTVDPPTLTLDVHK
ncbi:MAG TPA: CdaR family protein [Bacilli bacterium]|nr:CdaR family protein [Bacilli bacterium]